MTTIMTTETHTLSFFDLEDTMTHNIYGDGTRDDNFSIISFLRVNKDKVVNIIWGLSSEEDGDPKDAGKFFAFIDLDDGENSQGYLEEHLGYTDSLEELGKRLEDKLKEWV